MNVGNRDALHDIDRVGIVKRIHLLDIKELKKTIIYFVYHII